MEQNVFRDEDKHICPTARSGKTFKTLRVLKSTRLTNTSPDSLDINITDTVINDVQFLYQNSG